MRRSRDQPALPSPEELRTTAVYFLRQGSEEEEAELLSACVLELGEPRPIDGDGYIVSIALRAERKVIERLLAIGQPDHLPLPLMKRIKSALTLALPCAFSLGRLEARAAGPGIIPSLVNCEPRPAVEVDRPGPEPNPQPAPVLNSFQRRGRSWRVIFDGRPEFDIPDTLGCRYLDYLLHHPAQPISAFDLEVAIRSERANVRTKTSIQARSDAKAIQSYLRDLEALRAEREAAVNKGDLAESDRLDQEIESLEVVVSGTACLANEGERARNNVRHAIRAVRVKLQRGGKSEKAFADHVERFVSLGYQCVYNQPTAQAWG